MQGADIWDWLIRPSLAAAVGALVGGERESRGRPAATRTQAVVALASAPLTATGKAGFLGEAVDHSRIASQVVTGVGFIGAGVILKHRGTVTGLTTAATLFLSAGLGVAIGAGLIIPGLIAAAIGMVVVCGLRLVKPLLRNSISVLVQIDYIPGYGTFSARWCGPCKTQEGRSKTSGSRMSRRSMASRSATCPFKF